MSTCKHVYQIMNEDICSLCGGDTHETNWVQELEYRRAYVKKMGLFYKKVAWWSI